MSTFLAKDPGSELSYTLDWSDWLASGDSIATSVWSVPSDLTEEAESETSSTTTVRVSGGVAGQVYKITNTITTTTSGETAQRTITLACEER